jgi:erythromycin esterase
MRKIRSLFTLFALFFHSFCASQESDVDLFSKLVRDHKINLENAASLDAIIEMAAGRKVALLGEASHGTSEFYAWRDSISRRLIAEQGYSFILVEGDWASCFSLNRYVKGFSDYHAATDVVRQFGRWPPWMWRNEEVVALAEWLKDYNTNLPPDKRVGFYGMDVYDEWNSYDEVLVFLANYDPELHKEISEFYYCMKMFGRDSWQYAKAISRGYNACAPLLRQAFEQLDEQLATDEELHPYDVFYVMQNARVFKNAEKFYRKAVSDRAGSWNSRVQHMFTTLITLLEFHGEDAKGIVWAHNTHVGDARYTDMSIQGQVNSGQLAREHFRPENVLLVGFGTYTGNLLAGRQWGQEILELTKPEAAQGSLEERLYSASPGNFILVMNNDLRAHPFIGAQIGHRAAGVVYNPEMEHLGNYVPSIPGHRYDVFIFIEKTRALKFVR